MARGMNGGMTFDGKLVTITRTRLMARWTVGGRGKQVPLAFVEGIELRKATLLQNGFVRLQVVNKQSRAMRCRARFARSLSPDEDENTVMFNRAQRSAFEALHAELDQALAAR